MEPEELVTHLEDVDLRDAEEFRKKKETAILSIMFIDMVHSTALRETLGEIQFEYLRQQKKQELSVIIERNNHGKVIKDIGDGLLAVFAMPDLAVRIALHIQELLGEHQVFQVRIGIDMGQVTRESEQGIVKDVFGRHVNRAARLEALSEGGHVLVSYPIWDSAKGWLKHLEQISWKYHGSYELKGITEPQMVYEPYDCQQYVPLIALNGVKVAPEEELSYCQLCGRYVKLRDTCTCHTCGRSGICTTYCYDVQQRQCIECAARQLTVPAVQTAIPPSQTSLPVAPATRPEFDLFLIYAPQDQAFVLHLADYFVHAGLKIWRADEQIDVGDSVLEKVTCDLRRSRFAIVCLSRHFNASPWCRSEFAAVLRQAANERNACLLPVIVGDYQEVDIPDFLYDKYYVDVRTHDGIERLWRKVAPTIAPDNTPTDEVPLAIPETVRAAFNELQQQLLKLAIAPTASDSMVFEFDKIGIALLQLFEQFPRSIDVCAEMIAMYRQLAEQILHALHDQELRRVLLFRFRKVEEALEDRSGGFNYGDNVLARQMDLPLAESLYSCYGTTELQFEEHLTHLFSADELEESDGLDWLLRDGLAQAEARLRQCAERGVLKEVLAVLWKRMPRVFFHYSGELFWGLVKQMLLADPVKWKLRLYALKTLLKRSLTAAQAEDMLHNFVPAEQHVLSTLLLVHPKQECRELALTIMPPDIRWDILLSPHVPLLIVRELVAQSCQDGSDSYIKAVFLFLRPRLLAEDTPLALAETYQVLQVFYHHPVFLEETFFHALIDLHKQVLQKVQASPITQHLEAEFTKGFQAFCSKELLRDADITEMRHIPLPIQRKLAHDGYLPKFFICNTRDVIAVETVPHVERRPDVVKFFQLSRINARALEQLAANRHLMREYQNRAAFCRHPKANTTLVRSYLSSLTRADIKEIAHNRNVSSYARELALKYLSRYSA